MNRFLHKTRSSAIAISAVGLFLAMAGCSSSGTGDSEAGGSSQATNFKACVATGGIGNEALDVGIGQVAGALAEERGWDYVELSNNNDGPTAVKNAELFIQEKCNAVILFNGQPSVNPVMAAKFLAANIPVITFDIAQEGWYFVGIDNAKAGFEGGAALGRIVESKWDCQPDLVLSSEASAAGIVNEQRTGGMREGLLSVCPDIPETKFISFEGNGLVSEAQPAARAVLAANPDAKKIAVVGINDAGVVGALDAGEQLDRADEMIGWGQDGALISGSNVNPRLAGSVYYFLEGYPTYAFTSILDEIAAGSAPAVQDYTDNNPAVLVAPCPVTAAQAVGIPSMADRITQLLAAGEGATQFELFCPES